MKFGKLIAFALAGVLTFAACKYEEGPRISFRAKRDRVANEWEITKFTVGENDSSVIDKINRIFTQLPFSRPNQEDTFYNYEFKTILHLSRTGSYSVEVVMVERDSNNNPNYLTNHEVGYNGRIGFDALPACVESYRQMLAEYPAPFRYIFPRGEWSFDKGHYKIQCKPELGFLNDETGNAKNTLDWTIVKLSEKWMKVKGLDEFNNVWKMELKAINKEPYFY